ncbi:hypothetical protein PAHAL_2G264600 [Panicum hallii]|uniref:Uncharacterized protein n=1 Tax=Panicum hallii TaxID=206008 RepID=A0A2T8KQM5_9POAL|nr:hypothetical protein PAHAL_2G264600 [Panicum hallii]
MLQALLLKICHRRTLCLVHGHDQLPLEDSANMTKQYSFWPHIFRVCFEKAYCVTIYLFR